MSEPAPHRVTYQDVLDAPEGMVAEILGGELHLSPRPAASHAATTSTLGGELNFRFHRGGGDGQPGGWVILDEPELHLGDPDPTSVVMVPDLAGWRRERMPRVPAVAAFTLAPDWVCEVLSLGPANVRRDRMLKTELYRGCGVAWLWLVDPLARTVEVFRLEASRYVLVGVFGGDEEARIPPFDAIALDMSAWWPDLPEEG